MLEWQHNVHVTSGFRVKYLFIKRPYLMVFLMWVPPARAELAIS